MLHLAMTSQGLRVFTDNPYVIGGLLIVFLLLRILLKQKK